MNDIGASRRTKFRGDDLKCADRLPKPIRRALHESVVEWSALEIRWRLNRLLQREENPESAVRYLVAMIRDWDEEEIVAFACLWPARFGRYPHVAAQASIQRYSRSAIAP